MLSSSSTVIVSPLLSIKFNTSSATRPPIRLHHHTPPATAAAATTTASRTSTQETRNPTSSTSTYLRPQRMASSCAVSLYEILGIPVGATGQEIKTAYRRLARTCHPDVATYNRKDSSAGDFIKIHAAYCTLSDPEKRAVYDQNLFRRRRPLTSPSGFSGYSGRSWETDQCW